MKPAVVALTCAVCLVGLEAQEPSNPPAFEVVSVKPNVGADLGIPFEPALPDGIRLTNHPLESIVRYAFSVQLFRLDGLPAWTHESRFDIVARAAGPISDETRRLMTRALLTERFGLLAHFETREQTVYVMTLVQEDGHLGPGLTPRPDCGTSPCDSHGSGTDSWVRLQAVTLARLAEGMLSAVRGELVLDETGVVGSFDVDLSWRPDNADAGDERPAFVTAMQEQLGLKLEPQRRPVEVLVIDRVEHPTPN